MNHLIIIHWADSFLNQEDYHWFLRESYVPRYATPWEDKEKPDYKKSIAIKWKNNGGTVWYPSLPNKQNARYHDWKIVFEWILSQLNEIDEVTFIWGSLGGCFLLKYFSEMETSSFVIPTKSLSRAKRGKESIINNQSRSFVPQDDKKWNSLRISQIHLVAACISEWDFSAQTNYESLQQLGNRVHIWHAKDDKVVPFSVGQDLSKILPNAHTHFFSSDKWYGHFHGVEKFPELEEILI